MAEPKFHLEVITPERIKYNDEVNIVTVPGVEGQMGLLKGHAPILALLQPGVLMPRNHGREVRMAIGQGFIKMSHDRAVCLVDFAEQPDEVNVEAARQAQARLEKELAVPHAEEVREPLQMELRAARARLEVAASKKG